MKMEEIATFCIFGKLLGGGLLFRGLHIGHGRESSHFGQPSETSYNKQSNLSWERGGLGGFELGILLEKELS
jgi:hypothetical protein